MILFAIFKRGRNDEDADAFVSAHTRDEAVEIWRKWANNYDMLDEDDQEPTHVFLVPRLADKPMMHGWHSTEDYGAVLVSSEWDALETIAHAINHGITSYSQSNTEVTVE